MPDGPPTRDYFTLFDEPRRPWIDPDRLKQKYVALSAGLHPDRVHHLGDAERGQAHERSAELNAAYRCLSEPRERLRHLLELERGAAPADIQRVPPELMDLSLEVAFACRQADALAREKGRTQSALLKAQLFERSVTEIERLDALRKKLSRWQQELAAALKEVDEAWQLPASDNPSERARLLERIEEIRQLESYRFRWQSQLGERAVQLAV